MTREVLCVLVAAMVVGVLPAAACTNVFVAGDGARLTASNLDCSNVFPRIWFVPSGEGQNGRFCYGTDENQRIAEGGMNDRGLFIGVNALNSNSGWQADPNLPDWESWEGWYESGVPDGILAKCATVEEAIEIFRAYNLLTLAHVKFLLADRGGASAVIEWSQGKLVVTRGGDAGYQVSTNFVVANQAPGEAPCYRYDLAHEMLQAAAFEARASVETLRRILSATHLEFQTPTVLSAICDLVSGEIVVYYFHHFEDGLTFKLRDELRQERHGGLLADLFPIKPYVAKVYEDYRGR